MQRQNFKNEESFCDLINANNNSDELITGRTEDLIFDSNPVHWYQKVNFNKPIQLNHINDNSSSQTFFGGAYENQRVLEVNENYNFSVLSKVHHFIENDNSNIKSCSRILNEKAIQNIEILMPQSFKSKFLKDIYDINYPMYISCPECQTKNASNFDWCLSCGLFLIKQKNPNTVINLSNAKPIIKSDDNNLSEESHIMNNGNLVNLGTTETNNNFDRIYKRSYDLIPNHSELITPNFDFNRTTNEKINKNLKSLSFNEVDKLNLCDLKIEESERISKLCPEVNLNDRSHSHSNDTRSRFRQPVIPPLDLSSIDVDKDFQNQISEKKQKDESKENQQKPRRRWASSSMAWRDRPEKFSKKNSEKYRNKINPSLNKIGINAFQSHEKVNKIFLSEDIKGRRKINSEIELETNQPSILDQSEMTKYIDNQNSVNKILSINNCNISNLKYESFSGFFSISSWQCLPAEIWIKIMQYLPFCNLSKLQQTCRRFYSIGLDSKLWRSVTLYRNNNLTDFHIINIAQKMPKELHFKNCCGTSITFDGLKKMFSICGHGVEKLSFISCSKGALEGDQFLVLSADFCPNVTHINASYLMNLQDSTLISMTRGFNKIISLNLMGAHSISNQSITYLIKNHCSSLTSLDLYGCFKLNSETLKILEECLNLKSLALGSINKLKRTSIVGLLKKLSQLTTLDLRGTMNLIDDSLLAQICVLCQNLQQIILTNSCLVGNQGLLSLANSSVSKSLKVLDVCGCSRISDDGIEAVLKTCHNLEDIDISCTGITGKTPKLFNMYPPPNLKCLRINNNKLISEIELSSIIKSSKKLNTVYMCGITSIKSWRHLEATFHNIIFKHE